MYRDSTTIYLAIILPLPFYFLGTMEACRMFVYLLGSLFITIDRLQRSIFIVMGCIKKSSRFIYYYLSFLINIKRIEQWFNLTIYMALSGIFWVTVASCWITVKRGPSMGTNVVVYVTFVIIFCLFALVHIFLIPHLCNLAGMFAEIRQIQILRVKFKYSKWRTKVNKIELLQVKALFPFRIQYGKFWCLEKDLVPEYLWMLQSRCFDIVLILD